MAPQVFRMSLRINPILIILALLIGYQLYGIAGALVALPVASVIRQTVVYLRRHLVLEPWGGGACPAPGCSAGAGSMSGVRYRARAAATCSAGRAARRWSRACGRPADRHR